MGTIGYGHGMLRDSSISLFHIHGWEIFAAFDPVAIPVLGLESEFIKRRRWDL